MPLAFGFPDGASNRLNDVHLRFFRINERHADLAATVFSPQDKQGYFLVALGGRMSRQDAVRLQEKARAEGLARDVYVKKFLD